ncbi:DedA family protein [Candidatus Woesebacteria bacterium]|nr:MAG: DedA family protein [Candidatus Woesebacteria bacterium]
MELITHFFVENLTNLIEGYGLLAVFILMTAESVLIPIPSEITMPFAGFMAGRGVLDFWSIVFVGASANLVGSLLAYWLGYSKGEEWLRIVIKKWGKWLLIKESEFDKAIDWFHTKGQWVSFGSRMLPIVRTFISLPAGIAKMNVLLFSLLTFLGSFIWSAFLTYLGLKMGQSWPAIEPYFRQFQFLIVGLFLTGVGWYIWSHLKRKK